MVIIDKKGRVIILQKRVVWIVTIITISFYIYRTSSHKVIQQHQKINHKSLTTTIVMLIVLMLILINRRAESAQQQCHQWTMIIL